MKLFSKNKLLMQKIVFEYHGFGDYKNFANYTGGFPIVIDNVTYKTVNHYFQAQKFNTGEKQNQEIMEMIINAKDGLAASKIGKNRNYKIRGDWEKVKIEVMTKAVLAKFQQHEELKKELLETKDFPIIADNQSDGFWGNGEDVSKMKLVGANTEYKGLNHLGKILEFVREELKKEKN